MSSELPTAPVAATAHRALRPARLKAFTPMSFANDFAGATSVGYGVPLLTGDPEILAARAALGLDVIDLR